MSQERVAKHREHYIRTAPGDYPEFFKKVGLRDKMCCRVTGDAVGPFSAHHLLSRTRHPEYSIDVDNGVLILRSIHKQFHREFPNTTFTPNDFVEWVHTNYGVDLQIPSRILQVKHAQANTSD